MRLCCGSHAAPTGLGWVKRNREVYKHAAPPELASVGAQVSAWSRWFGGAQNHWSECGRAASIAHSHALGRPHRSVLALAHIRHTMPHRIHLVLAVTVIFLSGCDTGKVSLSDPQLAPMLQAIAAVDRAALGFTPIPTNAEVHLDSRSDARYDAMLIIFDTPARYGGVYRNIEFRKTATGYKWLREFETHPGPMTFKQLGNTDQQVHTAHEEISIIYDTTGISGVTPNKLHVHYNGRDSRIADRKDLALDEVRPILLEWSQKR